MSDRESTHPDDRQVERRVKELPRVDSDAAFRERLRSRFVRGTLEPETAAPRARLPWRRILAAAALAAAIVLALLNRSPELRVIDASGPGLVMIDGRPLPLTDLKELRKAVRSGAAVQLTDGARLDLWSDDAVLMELTAGTRLRIPRVPRPLFARASACSLAAGEMRIKTGPRFSGATWRIYTPHGMVELTGTLLSIQCDEAGTCVCVLEGVARVGVSADDLQPVGPGFRKVIKPDGTTEILPVKDMHRDGLVDFDRRVGSRMPGR